MAVPKKMITPHPGPHIDDLLVRIAVHFQSGPISSQFSPQSDPCPPFYSCISLLFSKNSPIKRHIFPVLHLECDIPVFSIHLCLFYQYMIRILPDSSPDPECCCRVCTECGKSAIFFFRIRIHQKTILADLLPYPLGAGLHFSLPVKPGYRLQKCQEEKYRERKRNGCLCRHRCLKSGGAWMYSPCRRG